jgi:hypothetical protein
MNSHDHSCFVVPNQRYEFVDADEAVLSDLALSNGTMMSPAWREALGVFDKLGKAVGLDWMGESGRKLDLELCWVGLGEAMLICEWRRRL